MSELLDKLKIGFFNLKAMWTTHPYAATLSVLGGVVVGVILPL